MRNFLKQCLTEMDFNVSENQLDSFMKYNELMLEWNEKINLTAITEQRDVVIKHFCDSTAALKLIPQGASVVDVGAGAGFPSLPLKIMRPDLKILMLDSLNKRINFLNEMTEKLSLENISAVHARAEELSKKELRESFDVCVSRAVARLCVLAELCIPFVKVGGSFLAYKGPAGIEEINEGKHAVELLGGEITEVKKYNLPNSDICHSVIVIKKVRQTPPKYPRNSGKISKTPIV